MLQKPKHLGPEYGEVFKDASVVEAYHHRPPYPAEVFAILAGLIKGEPRRVLDVGCGTGAIARVLVERVDQLDAVDFSRTMLETGKALPNGDDPRLRWLYGPVEELALDPPYGLVTAGASLHWMDWNRVLPRFHEVLTAGGSLAIVGHDALSVPWFEALREIIPRYSTNKDFQDYDMVGALERHGLFHKAGEQETAPVPFVQSVDDYIESFHSRNGFSRERMGPVAAAAFDQEARNILLPSYPDGVISLQIVANIVWGVPRG
ncbi:MAG: class I SAM-dependent methyltransferase [Ktedonobacteraceae bacterium]|nr:class I SAM-dependent methyltransferase [Ktedonobacteraceae bacterium]